MGEALRLIIIRGASKRIKQGLSAPLTEYIILLKSNI